MTEQCLKVLSILLSSTVETGDLKACYLGTRAPNVIWSLDAFLRCDEGGMK